MSTSKCFIIRVEGSKSWAEYRILALTREAAEQRAQANFRREFGVEGSVYYVEEV